MNFIKLIVLTMLIVSVLNADEVRYMCPPSGLISVNIDGKKEDLDLTGVTDAERFIMKTEWYGKPIYLAHVRKKGNLILKNTQSKVEWIQSDLMTFKTEGNERGRNIKISISLEKGSSPILALTFEVTNAKAKKAVTTQQCYKE